MGRSEDDVFFDKGTAAVHLVVLAEEGHLVGVVGYVGDGAVGYTFGSNFFFECYSWFYKIVLRLAF